MTAAVSEIVRIEVDRWRRDRVSEAVARAGSASHRTPEHAAWCRHLYERRCLSADHEVCLAVRREVVM